MGRHRNTGGSAAFPPIGPDSMKQITVTLSQAQVQSMFAAPVEILPAPGVGLTIIPISAIFLHASATPFTGGGDVHFCVGAPTDGATWSSSSNPGLTTPGPVVAQDLVYNDNNGGHTNPTVWANQPFSIYNDSAAFAGAGGTLQLTLFYAIAPI